MIKWKCHNCDNEFTSESYQDYIEETTTHLSECLEHNDFIELLEDDKRKGAD